MTGGQQLPYFATTSGKKELTKYFSRKNKDHVRLAPKYLVAPRGIYSPM
jgi:hypothetical protein